MVTQAFAGVEIGVGPGGPTGAVLPISSGVAARAAYFVPIPRVAQLCLGPFCRRGLGPAV